MLYFGSPTHDIPYFDPADSNTHRKYLTTTCLYPLALMHCCEWDHFDFITIPHRDELILFECRPEAFKETFSGKSGSLYVFDNVDFRAVGTRVEYRTNRRVSPIAEILIHDVYISLMSEKSKHSIEINYYTDSEEYKLRILHHIQDILDQDNLSMLDMVQKDERFHAFYGMWLHHQNRKEE